MEPFRIDVPQEELDDLRARLRSTRWPERETVDDWSQGVPLDYVRELCEYWAEEYDWRATEARLNAIPQYRTEIDGLGIHLLHVRSPEPDATPLVLTHGWPGSIIEFLKVIDLLTNPADPRDAFHVVCPTLPGFGFSDRPEQPGWGIGRIAGAWTVLMRRLGYGRFGASGGDWGTSVSTEIARLHPESLIGMHLVPPLAPPDPATFGSLTDRERAALATLEHAAEWESGYSRLHATRPQTIGYGLVDSPALLCAWIIEKFWSWTDCDGHPENALSRDELLDNLMFYWLTRTGASSARLYWESIRQVDEWISGEVDATLDVPAGCSVFPKEIQRPSRRWAEKRFTDIRYWNEPAKGGHFAAFEQPGLFAADVRAFFRRVTD
ncbi:epoxide hydrolase family protein [Kibdelosporangium persicum]|uniref:Pimeloyl-ACP methyl ester carboxylesterase n=1 Tax=Kibdelosporangium persicum TaxID=2698649 RepID=A0ABX2F9U2_9PSEU|nr:epoxide hydrolase family protein [Kibdelosporangium persicum]NRN67666.1 Pimeloyl-ACP methyl ester carboxylesterase [Kibdelosporangium persicum]